MCKAILPLMVKQNGGSIINVSSCASSLKGFPNRFVYGTTKGAVIGLTKSIAIDFVKQNVRCNSIAPGTVFSPSWQERVNQSPDPVQAKKDFKPYKVEFFITCHMKSDFYIISLKFVVKVS